MLSRSADAPVASFPAASLRWVGLLLPDTSHMALHAMNWAHSAKARVVSCVMLSRVVFLAYACLFTFSRAGDACGVDAALDTTSHQLDLR